MTQDAERILTEPAEIDRLKALIAALPNGARVELQFEDGRRLRAIVSVRPTLQVFRDAAGGEGVNSLVRVEEPALEAPESAAVHDIWLDQVRHVIQLSPAHWSGQTD
ncbi:DUF3247 family protein [Lysobacter sp. D1-1-M9]|uniref:DUF3247 family protein n=1 Tax=Novilysobacter longmucuonensis TaxID=3098603 RepID=UPI002FC79ECD